MTLSPKPQWFDWRMSIGNLISIVILIFGMAASYYALKQEQALQAQSLDGVRLNMTALQARMEKLETERNDMRDRLIRLEIGQSQQNDILRQVLDAVKADRR